MADMSMTRKLLIFTLLLFALAPAARATWYSENIEDGADVIMMDLRWPWWPSGTYYANWNSSFNPKPNNITFYAGFTSTVPELPGWRPNLDAKIQDAFRPGTVWSFWGESKAGEPVRFVDVAPNLFIKNVYGGEGLSGTVGSEPWTFIKPGRWYTMLARVWQPLGDSTCAYVGRWIKDSADGRWHLIAVARLPIAATSFSGNSGFIEPLSGEMPVRPLHRRFGYFRKDGVWKKSDTISIDKTQYVVVNTPTEGDHEYAAIEYSQRPDLLPMQLQGKPLDGDKKYFFKVKQPDQPALIAPAVADVSAKKNGAQLVVSWKMADTSSPAFSYKVEVFDNPQCRGEPRVVKEERNPSARTAMLDIPRLDSVAVRLTVTDIFDQPAPTISAAASVAKAGVQPAPAGATIPGLSYTLFEKDTKKQSNYFYDPLQNPKEEHTWLTLDQLTQGKLVRQGLSRGFDLGLCEQRGAGYGMVFKGFLRVPEDGLYVFHAQIDGGYRLEIDGHESLVWDGQHGTTEKTAVENLAKGDHPIVVTYLYDELPAANFSIEWEGPHFSREAIPLENLRSIDQDASPVPTMTGTPSDDGSGRVVVSVDARGHHLDSTALYLGALRLAESDGATVRYDGPLPEGKSIFFARVIFDGNHSADSEPLEMVIHGKPVAADWTVRNVGGANPSAGLWQKGTDGFQFFGNGMHTAMRRVKGDFTATCRIDAYNGQHGEPVNRSAWVGLAAFENAERANWNWGESFYCVQTAGEGLRASADFTDFGAGRISSFELPKNRPWIRIARHGDIWTVWTSDDGRKWELGDYQYKRAHETMDVGLFFSALPQEARAHYFASVSHVEILPGVLAAAMPPTPPVATHTSGNRLTGVAMPLSDPSVVVIRSTNLGLLRSTDGGKTWTAANGKLQNDDLAVRSVAIHPSDPRIMLRAGGTGHSSRLWKTTDGGTNWQQLDFPGDFDGAGPSALCGEIIAFDLRNPQTLYVGCESKGFFKSEDGGATWAKVGLDGQRVTSVVVWPWERYYPAPAHGKTQICVTTCPDVWMSYLGRGEPGIATSGASSVGYISNDNVNTLTPADQRADTGFYNVAFDKAMQSIGEMRYATTHGFQTQVSAGANMALYPPEKSLEWLRPFTAVGATAMGEQKFGRFFTQALDPENAGRFSCSQEWAFSFFWVKPAGDVPHGGLISVSGDQNQGRQWWFVCTDGLYHSSDGGQHLERIMDESGKQGKE